MRRIARLIAIMCALVAASPATAAAYSAGHDAATVTLRVVRCKTEFGVPPGRINLPSHLSIRGVPGSTSHLVAYSNTSTYLIAPANLDCAGLVGADGSSSLVVWPHGQREPREHSSGSGLSLFLIPACVGCKATTTCPYFATFRAYAHQVGLPCPEHPPSGERVRYLTEHLVGFVDPSFVAGVGWPSGHMLSASGLIGIEPGLAEVVFTSTCTLPTSSHASCTDSADAERSLYG